MKKLDIQTMSYKIIKIRIKKEKINITLNIKKSVLDLYSNTFFDKNYSDKKRFINSQIKNLISTKPDEAILSNLVAKFLLFCVEEEVRLLKRKII